MSGKARAAGLSRPFQDRGRAPIRGRKLENAIVLSFCIAISFPARGHGQDASQPPASTSKPEAQATDLPPFAKPAALQLLYEDHFLEDSRESYAASRPNTELTWERGALTLPEVATISRKFTAGSWVVAELELSFETPENASDVAEVRLQFEFDPASNSYLTLRTDRSAGVVRSAIELHGIAASSDDNEVGATSLVRRKEFPENLPDGHWRFVYRHGLWCVQSPEPSIRFCGYLENGLADVTGLRLTAQSAALTIKHQLVRGEERREFDPGQRQAELEEAAELNSQVFEFFRSDRFAEAVPLAKKALEIRQAVFGKYHRATSQSMLNLAAQYQGQGSYKEAEPLLLEAHVISERIFGKAHPDYAFSLNNLAAFYMSLGKDAQAEPLLIEAISINEDVLGEENIRCAISRHNLGDLQRSLGNYAKALENYLQSKAVIYRTVGTRNNYYVRVLHGLAALYQRTGDFALAEQTLLESKAIHAEAVGQENANYATCLHRLAAVYHSMGDFSRAESLFLEAKDIRQRVLGNRHPSHVNSLNAIAVLYDAMGKPELAQPILLEAKSLWEDKLGAGNTDHAQYAEVLSNLGSLYANLGEYSQAMDLLQEAKDIRERLLGKEDPEYSKTLNNLGGLYKDMGNYAEAERLYKEATAIRAKVLGKDHPDYGRMIRNLALLYHSMANYERAEPLYIEGFDRLLEHLERMSASQSESQQLQAARLVEHSLKNYFTFATESGCPLDSVASAGLRWKGAILARERLTRLERITDSPKIRTLLKDLRLSSSRIASHTFSVPVRKQDRAVWRKKLDQLNQDHERIERQLTRESAPYRDTKSALRFDVQKLRNVLPPDAALVDIHYYEQQLDEKDEFGIPYTERAYCALIIRPEEIKLEKLGSRQEIDTLIARWRKGVTASVADESQAGRGLREWLWEPLEHHLEGVKTVLVSPTGATSLIPWSALPGKAPNSYLLEQWALVTVPAPQMLVGLFDEDQHQVDRPQRLLLIGGVDFDKSEARLLPDAAIDRPRTDAPPPIQSSQTPIRHVQSNGRGVLSQQDPAFYFSALPGTKAEIGGIAERFEQNIRQNGSEILTGSQATKSRFLALAPQSRYLHVATHGFFAPKTIKSALAIPMRDRKLAGRAQLVGYHPGLLSGLVFAGANRTADLAQSEDSFLTAIEVAELDLSRVELAVLSACETGLGEVAGGEGILGLQRALQAAGARTTMTSLWKVDDRATQELMHAFYDNLWVKKQRKIDALRNAQLQLLNQPLLADGTDLRGDIRLKAERINNREKTDVIGRGHIRHWAAFQLSGDWR